MRRKQKETRELQRAKSMSSGSTRSLTPVRFATLSKHKQTESPPLSSPPKDQSQLTAITPPTVPRVLTSDASISTTPDPPSALSFHQFPTDNTKLRPRCGFSPGPQHHKSTLLMNSRRPGSSLADANGVSRMSDHSAGRLMTWKTSSELFASLTCDSPAKTPGKSPLSRSRKPGLSWLAEPLSKQLTGYLTLKQRRLKRRSPAHRPSRESALSVVITMLG
jgi:hypothetical protein